jgi:hypothetical protein
VLQGLGAVTLDERSVGSQPRLGEPLATPIANNCGLCRRCAGMRLAASCGGEGVSSMSRR